MKTIPTILILSAVMAFSQQADKKEPAKPVQVAKADPKAESPSVQQFPKPLDEVTVLKLENLQLKAEKAQKQIQDWTAEYGALISATCTASKLTSAECVVGKDGGGNWMVTKNAPPPADKK